MKTNSDKFQAIAIGKKTVKMIPTFIVNDIIIKCEESVKLLGVEIDSVLNFDK